MASTQIVQAFQEFIGLRYFSVVSFITVFYDHLISLDEEVNTIWQNPNVSWQSKVAFVANRYVTEIILALVVYVFSGTGTGLNTTACREFLWVYGIACVFVGAISHFLIIIRVYGLWDRRKGVAKILIAMFIVNLTATTILGVIAVIQMQREIISVELGPLRSCQLVSKPKEVTALLAVMSLFDFAVVMLVIFNAMDRPRQPEVPIVAELRKDGVGVFLVIFALRFADAMISISQNMPRVLLAFTTVWGISTIINARMHMRLEGLALARAHGRVILLADMWDM